ncbi:MAG: hypothetical protein LIP10_16580 [Clostridiales bacterium]|nr:hypothetical protein [Clostridiales bacterium]
MRYQLLDATVYLISLSYNQTLDITLVLYMIFAVLPYIKNFKIYIGIGACLLFYFALNMSVSMIINGAAASISVFCIRLAGLFIYYYIFRNIDFRERQGKKLINFNFVCLATVCEIIIFLIGYFLSTDERLMLNYQCTVGCIATATLLYLAYYLYVKETHTIGTMLCMIIMTLIACMSGTRGYIVVSLTVTFMSFFMKANKKWRIFLILVGILVLLIAFRYLADIFLVNLRMGSGTGRRQSENLFVIQFMWKRPLYVWLIGNGFGTVAGSFSISESIISAVSNSSYTYQVLHTATGFHNFYITILYSSGLVGLGFVLYIYI